MPASPEHRQPPEADLQDAPAAETSPSAAAAPDTASGPAAAPAATDPDSGADAEARPPAAAAAGPAPQGGAGEEPRPERDPGSYAVPLFFRHAMQARARALGRSYEPYRPPQHMTERLRFIDRMAGSAAPGETLSALHRQGDEDGEERPAAAAPEAEARFYHQAELYLSRQQQHSAPQARTTARNNLRVVGIVVLGIAAYYATAHLWHRPQVEDLESFRAALPLQLDAATRIESVDESGEEFVMHIIKDASYYASLTSAEIAARFEDMARAAPQQLCRIRVMQELVNEQGKRLTVSLATDDQTITRVFSIEHCATAAGSGRGDGV